VWVLAVVTVLALTIYIHGHVSFDWQIFVAQLKLARRSNIAIAVALIWLGYMMRSIRWAIIVKPVRKVGLFYLFGTQVIGFTAVALVGRPADFVRPYLVSKRMQVPLSTQMAAYVVDRMFDFGSMALIFSLVLLFSPDKKTLPHPELLHKIALSGLASAFVLVILVAAMRFSGRTLATSAEKIIGKLSPSLGASVGVKMLAFRNGLEMLESCRDTAAAFVISVLMWIMISGAYLSTTRAFVNSPQLANITLARCMVLMAASMLASSMQLPIIGWFTQIAAVAATMQQLFQVALEPALGCAALLLIVTFLSVVPLGLIFARIERISLRRVSDESKQASD
jgi:hypothetical protein